VTQCSVFSKHPPGYCQGWPTEVAGGIGATIQDHLGGQFIDWTWSGTGILGHAHPEITEFTTYRLKTGYAFGLPHVLERETAELMCEMLPGYAESVRFELNGTDVVSGAVRLARAIVGVQSILCFPPCYHGDSSDWCVRGNWPARGVGCLAGGRSAIVTAFWNDTENLADNIELHHPAAVIFEVRTPPTPEFVDAMNSLPSDILLIADEVVTGFRIAKGGACELYGIHPDLACFGKALGSGVPISALVGKEKYMREFDLDYTNEPVFMSYTHGGNALGLAAAKKTLEIIRDTDAIEEIWAIGTILQGEFLEQALARSIPVEVNNQPPRHSFIFEDVNGVEGRALFTLFQQKMCEQGVLIGPTNCPTIAHSGEPLDKTIEAMKESMESVLQAVQAGTVEGELRGPVPEPLYSRRT